MAVKVWRDPFRTGMAVSVWLVEFRLCAASLDGYGAFRLGRVRFDWLRSGKAVLVECGGVRKGVAWWVRAVEAGHVIVRCVKASLGRARRGMAVELRLGDVRYGVVGFGEARCDVACRSR